MPPTHASDRIVLPCHCCTLASRARSGPCHTHALTATGNTSRAGWEWPTCGIGSSLGGPAEHAGRTWSGTASPVVLWQQGNSPDRGPSPHSRTRGRTAVSRCCAARACKTSTCDPWRDRPVSAKSSERPRTRVAYKSKAYGSMLFACVRWNSTVPAYRFTLTTHLRPRRDDLAGLRRAAYGHRALLLGASEVFLSRPPGSQTLSEGRLSAWEVPPS